VEGRKEGRKWQELGGRCLFLFFFVLCRPPHKAQNRLLFCGKVARGLCRLCLHLRLLHYQAQGLKESEEGRNVIDALLRAQKSPASVALKCTLVGAEIFLFFSPPSF